MDLPLMTTESEIPPVADNLVSALDQTGSSLPHYQHHSHNPAKGTRFTFGTSSNLHQYHPPPPPTLSPLVSPVALIAAVSMSMMEVR